MKHKKVALIGNPNVGKSTVFNALTGMHQHTGNWPGKTVENAYGECILDDTLITIYDLPGTYSLVEHSLEEKVASDFICFEDYDVAVVVCDAVCLERSLNLVLQTMEIIPNVVVCVNLMDEAKKKRITIDLEKLENILGVPVVGTSARSKEGLDALMNSVLSVSKTSYYNLKYPNYIEHFIDYVSPSVVCSYNPRWVCLKLLKDDQILSYLPEILTEEVKNQLSFLRKLYREEDVVSTILEKAKSISQEVITYEKKNYDIRMRKVDKILTSKRFGIPIMIFMLFCILWITIRLSNVPSTWLFECFGFIETKLFSFLTAISFPVWIRDLLLSGVYRTLTWVVSVMLPPMAIFFPLFTLLEDLGVLPRIAFNLDYPFEKCKACGKQSLTMCMGLGCNAVGVMGARIIDSKRERFLAILTNSFMPCNGRFPSIISMITMFIVGFSNHLFSSFLSAFVLTLVILLGILMTFLVSFLLSKTLLKGYPSSFTLELPPYRKPQIGKVIVRSIFDRTLFVLGRAIVVAAPAGFLIYVLANVMIGGESIISFLAGFLNPIGVVLGLDGMILLAFLLGFPANEIVLPILMLGYLSLGSITEINDLVVMKSILVDNGWTLLTAINFILLCLFHFPCSTTILTIKRETNSWKWAIIAFLLPTFIGFCLCLFVHFLFFLF